MAEAAYQCHACIYRLVPSHKEPCRNCTGSSFERDPDWIEPEDVAELRLRFASLQSVVKTMINNANDLGRGCGYYRVPKDYIDQLKRMLEKSEK